MARISSRGRRTTLILRAVILVALGAILAWQVVARSLVAYLATAAPETALTLQAGNPVALLSLADGALPGLDLERRKDGEPAAATDPARAAENKSQASEETSGRLRVWAELAKSVDKGRRDKQVSELAKSPSAPGTGFGAEQARDRAQVRGWAELALAGEPLSAHALRILGQLADANGEDGRAEKFMRAAARRSVRESVALYWMMRKSYEEKDYRTAIYCADALLRTRSGTMPYVMPTLVEMAQNKDANGELKKLLAGNPPWRGQFFWSLPRSVTDARMPLDILLAVRDTPTPPTPADLKPYLDVLIAHKYFELAYYTWLQFMGPEQLRSIGLLFNGSFEAAPSGLPFDWVMRGGAGATVEILERPDQEDQHALFIEFSQGRVEFPGVVQLLMLAPGTYRFKGRYRGEIVGRRGLIWRALCAGETGAPIGESAMTVGQAPVWRDIEFTFNVPNANCRAQQLRLDLDARMASEQLVSGAIWYDELRVQRVE
jgi:hypothetical protein